MSVEKDAMNNAYLDVRDDKTETTWAAFKYAEDGKTIIHVESGTDYEVLLGHCTEDERAYFFVRVETGDEMSKRAKFAFITWIGCGVSPLKKAKVSTDKALVKSVIQSFAVEVMAHDKHDVSFDHVKQLIMKAGGANYGTGVHK